jgi:hypothetical protein
LLGIHDFRGQQETVLIADLPGRALKMDENLSILSWFAKRAPEPPRIADVAMPAAAWSDCENSKEESGNNGVTSHTRL